MDVRSLPRTWQPSASGPRAPDRVTEEDSAQNRRQFLGRALMAGAGAVVLMPAPAKASPRSSTASSATGVDPNFVAGQVAQLDGDSVTVVQADGTVQPMLLTSSSQVWKQGEVGAQPLQVGDGLYARGIVNPAGALQVDNAWVGIANFSGTIVQPGSQQLVVSLDGGLGNQAAQVNPAGTMLEANGGTQVVDSLSALAGGDYVQVIGYCSADSPSAITATRILLFPAAYTGPTGTESSSPQPPPGSSTSPSDATCCQYSYQRIATWMCCGGVNDCGSLDHRCYAAGTGKCGTCYTNVHGIAWPNTYDANGQNECEVATQGGSSCDPQLPFLDCGTSVDVHGMCTGKSVTTQVVDCGPVPRCTTTNRGCYDYYRIAFDLTACAFTYLGGGLDYGHLDVQCTVCLHC